MIPVLNNVPFIFLLKREIKQSLRVGDYLLPNIMKTLRKIHNGKSQPKLLAITFLILIDTDQNSRFSKIKIQKSRFCL